MQPQESSSLHLERFAVLANVFPGRAVFVPHKLPSLEVFCLRSTGHPGGSQDIEYPVLMWKINLIFKSSDGDLRAREGPKDLLHHGEMLPDVRMYFLSNIKAFLVPVVMSLEEGEPKVELKHDAPCRFKF